MFEGISCAASVAENNPKTIDLLGSNLAAYRLIYGGVKYDNGTKPLEQRVTEKRLIMIEVATIGVLNIVCLFGCAFGMLGSWGPRDVFKRYTNNVANRVKHQYNVCAICRDTVKITDNIEVTECGHCYHEACIKKWTVGCGKDSCPCCRTRITF